MRLPRFRIWVLMVIVAIAATVCGALGKRSQEFRRQAQYHREAAGWLTEVLKYTPHASADLTSHQLAAEKYEYAAAHPWLSVEPAKQQPHHPIPLLSDLPNEPSPFAHP
jgi:hypothetical protein